MAPVRFAETDDDDGALTNRRAEGVHIFNPEPRFVGLGQDKFRQSARIIRHLDSNHVSVFGDVTGLFQRRSPAAGSATIRRKIPNSAG